MKSYSFKGPEEILEFIQKEVMKYTGCFVPDRIMYGYNRMTVEEVTHEVYIKILRSVNKDINKSYVRQAVVFVCLDLYRKQVEDDGPKDPKDLEISEEEVFDEMERLMQLHKFTPKELRVVELLLEGKRNPEVRKELKIPKMSYYTLLNKIKSLYTDN